MADQYNQTKDSASEAAQYGQEKTGQAQQQAQGMMDTTKAKASQGSQAAMGKAQQTKEQTGSIFQQTGDKVSGGMQSAMEGVKSAFGANNKPE